MGLRIVVSDAGYYPSLVDRLVSEGHTVHLTMPNLPPGATLGYLPGDGTYMTDEQVVLAAVANSIDLYVGFELGDTLGTTLRMFDLPVLMHDESAFRLETNRALGAAFIQHRVSGVRVAKAQTFDSLPEVKKFLAGSKSKLVVKPAPNSVGQADNDLRCHFSTPPHRNTLALVAEDGGYFDEDGQGSVRIEEFLPGVETCVGCMFDGTKFDTVFYICHEHKDAQNDSRSGVLTGEVGSTLTWHHRVQNPVVDALLDEVAQSLKGTGAGFIDLNLMLDPKRKTVTLIEWTVRWGRPTMELVLATYMGDFGAYLHRAAAGKIGTVVADYAKAALGIVVYPYGYPLVPGNEKPQQYPPCFKKTKGAALYPLTCVRLTPTTYIAQDRYAVAVAVADTIPNTEEQVLMLQARATALAARMDIPGNTWRDDIGSHWLDDLETARICLGLNRG